MHVKSWFLPLIGLLLLGLVLTLASCAADETSTPLPTQEPCPTCPPPPEPCPECEACPEPEACPSSVAAPFEDLWMASAHADAEAEAFVHWAEDDPPEVPISCAKCHSSYGYQDFLGADGSEAFAVDQPAEIGSVINCVACHNGATKTLASVTFPSGMEVSELGDEARCMQCHQGRASTGSVDASIEEAGLADMDTPSEDLGFTNIHYYAAAATQFGTWAMGGYEYEGKAYDAKFQHVESLDSCIDCHDPHTLEVQAGACAGCHEGVTAAEDLKEIRAMGSKVDYDGDGDVEEGIFYELEGLRAMLYTAMQRYAEDVAGTAIVYAPHTYPYFFIDTNANGEIEEDEANYGNQFNAWTGRLAKAAYNYQTSLKDPGAFAHGGKYIIELLYDSIEDLNSALSDPVDLATARRIDAGHFASSQEAFRHWDEDGAVPGGCARCHSDSGLPTYLQEGVNVSVAPSSGFRCTTCHDAETFEPYTVEAVRFPSGAMLDSGDPASNICLNCHQGRESGVSVDGAVAGFPEDEVVPDARFVNVHYFAAGATLFGASGRGAYQYPDQTYAGPLEHVENLNTCIECHDPHGLTVDTGTCDTCHDTEDASAIRMSEIDFDGDGDVEEGLAMEIATLHEALYAAMQTYAADVLDAPVLYNAASYPYFFNDTNGNGEADPDEINYGNQFSSWSPRLLKAAYNYQYVAKDPGAAVHNGPYILQILYDSLADLGADVSGATRP